MLAPRQLPLEPCRRNAQFPSAGAALMQRNQLALGHRVAALNLRRLVNLGLDHNGHRWILT